MINWTTQENNIFAGCKKPTGSGRVWLDVIAWRYGCTQKHQWLKETLVCALNDLRQENTKTNTHDNMRRVPATGEQVKARLDCGPAWTWHRCQWAPRRTVITCCKPHTESQAKGAVAASAAAGATATTTCYATADTCSSCWSQGSALFKNTIRKCLHVNI